MIRFGISFDSLDDLKLFVGEIIDLHFVNEYRVSTSHTLNISIDCEDAFEAYMLIGEVRTILRNLRLIKKADIFSIEFCELPD